MNFLQCLRNRVAAFVHDFVMIPLAWFGAYWVRFNLESIPPDFFRSALGMLPVVILAQGLLFWHFGLYRGVWRFASMPDLVRITKAIVVGTTAIAGTIFLIRRMDGIPRSVLPLYGVLLFGLVAAPRFAYRWIKDHKLYRQDGKKALIVGAGRAGEMLVRDLLRDPHREYEPTAFVDDNPKKRGQDIHGVRVVGTTADIPQLVSDIDIVLIALPAARSSDMRRIVGICESTSVPFRTLPKLQDLVAGRASVRALRDVNIDDLLGREPVKLDWSAIRDSLRNRCVLVTGGGGSIGSELCRQIAKLQPSKLVVIEQSEFNLYTIDLELRRQMPDVPLVSVLGDVGDRVLVAKTFSTHRPNVVFHAAAYKHVPMLEYQSRSAVRNNVIGSRVIAQAAEQNGCERFVLISSDKAVKPGNVMGATKQVAEIYCQSLNLRSRTRFITVRFGNVLGSAGSVIPLFRKQIAEGGPVTVTDPGMTRYFMTIPEAAQLILQASSVGKGGEIFVLDMGEPVNIKYLAEQLILLSGKKPGEDIEIIYTGLRPGEKMHEELFQEDEELIPTSHPKLMLARSRALEIALVEQAIDEMADACEQNDDKRIRDLLNRFMGPSLVRDADRLPRVAAE